MPLPPALAIQGNESISRWVALILEALGRSLEQKQCLCLLEADWARLWGFVPVGSRAQAVVLLTQKRPRGTVCIARVQPDILMTANRSTAFPQHFYISEGFWFALLFVLNVSLCLWHTRSTFCLVSIQESRKSSTRGSGKVTAECSATVKESRKDPSPPSAVRLLRSPHQHHTLVKIHSCLPLWELTGGPCLLAEPFTTLGTDLTEKESLDDSVQRHHQ